MKIDAMITTNRMFFSLVAVLVLISSSPTAHSQTSENMSAASEDKSAVSSCEESSNYSNLRAVDCYKEQLADLDKKISKSLQEVFLNKSSSSEQDADDEIKNRIRAAQSGWEQYRENHCSFDYVSKAKTHPPSHSLRMIRCQVSMTRARLIEIQKTYKNF